MIVGEFRNRFLRVNRRLGEESEREIEFILDTGFGGELTLPFDVLQQLGAQRVGREPMRLADGVPRLYEIYQSFAEIGDEVRAVEVIAIEGEPLFGIGLMREQTLTADITEGGEFVLDDL